MIALLDANVLIAIIDTRHTNHALAESRFLKHRANGWATCPLTESAVLRIMGHPRYPEGPGSVSMIETLLADLIAKPGHRFWPDDISLLTCDVVRRPLAFSSKHLIDTYLLALAVVRGAKLATLDHDLQTQHVVGGVDAVVRIV